MSKLKQVVEASRKERKADKAAPPPAKGKPKGGKGNK